MLFLKWTWLIVSLEGLVTSKIHAKIIQKYVVSTLQKHFSHGNKIFQEDNTIPYYSKVAVTARKNVEIVMFP